MFINFDLELNLLRIDEISLIYSCKICSIQHPSKYSYSFCFYSCCTLLSRDFGKLNPCNLFTNIFSLKLSNNTFSLKLSNIRTPTFYSCVLPAVYLVYSLTRHSPAQLDCLLIDLPFFFGKKHSSIKSILISSLIF